MEKDISEVIRAPLRAVKGIVTQTIDFPRCFIAYREMRKFQQENQSTAIFLMSYAVGDVAYCMACVRAWRAQHPGTRITLIAGPKLRDMIESYDCYDAVMYYDIREKKGYRTLVCLNRSKYYSLKGQREQIFTTIPIYVYGRRTGNNCLALLKKYLELPQDTPIEYPRPAAAEVTAIPDFELVKGHVAVINAYATNTEACPCGLKIMNSIVEKMKGMGYTVYSNVVGNQKPLDGTLPLRCGLLELYWISDGIPIFITVRSGIVDWLVSTRSKKFVIYHTRVSAGFAKIYEMKAWNVPGCKEVFMAQMSDQEILYQLETWVGEKADES